MGKLVKVEKVKLTKVTLSGSLLHKMRVASRWAKEECVYWNKMVGEDSTCFFFTDEQMVEVNRILGQPDKWEEYYG